MPQAAAEATRRVSSCSRSSVRATSTPPDSTKTPSSTYWRMLSSVSAVISFEWSTGKMKLEACPVDPPGFGSGPLSSSRTPSQPSLPRWWATLEPTIPEPITTARLVPGSPFIALIYQTARRVTGQA